MAFSQLGEVRSLLPDGVHMMALTATATKDTQIAVCKKLHPAVISQVPNRPNTSAMHNIIASKRSGVECMRVMKFTRIAKLLLRVFRIT